MDSELMALHKEGRITGMEAYMKATNKSDFESKLSAEDLKFLKS
jgi:hypothetical protein